MYEWFVCKNVKLNLNYFQQMSIEIISYYSCYFCFTTLTLKILNEIAYHL